MQLFEAPVSDKEVGRISVVSVESVLFLLIIKTDDNHSVSRYNYVLLFIVTSVTTAQRGVTAEDV